MKTGRTKEVTATPVKGTPFAYHKSEAWEGRYTLTHIKSGGAISQKITTVANCKALALGLMDWFKSPPAMQRFLDMGPEDIKKFDTTDFFKPGVTSFVYSFQK